jgi:ANTAR domain
MNEESDILELRNEIQRLLAAALNREVKHDAEMQRRDDLHLAETERRDELHIAELGRRDQLHIDEMALLAVAIESRDIIGQAKGVIIVTVGCSADEAFKLLKAQSQHENRKVVDVAAEIAARAQRKDTSGWSESSL